MKLFPRSATGIILLFLILPCLIPIKVRGITPGITTQPVIFPDPNESEQADQFPPARKGFLIEKKPNGSLVLVQYFGPESDVVVPEGVTEIAPSAFDGFVLRQRGVDLTSVILPDGLTTIGDHAFYVNNELHSVSFPDSLQSIGKLAFAECPSLKTVSMESPPLTFLTIADGAFSYCGQLERFDPGKYSNIIYGKNVFLKSKTFADSTTAAKTADASVVIAAVLVCAAAAAVVLKKRK